MPLSAGARRTWSTHDDSFWCCVGSGMESHSKHGYSIYWHDASTLYVNLFIASTLDWDGWKLDLATRFPFEDKVTLTVTKPGKTRDLALRLPGWANDPTIARSEEHTSELQSLMRISYAVFCLKKKKKQYNQNK